MSTRINNIMLLQILGLIVLCAVAATASSVAADPSFRKPIKAILPIDDSHKEDNELAHSGKDVVEVKRKVDEDFVNEHLPKDVVGSYYEGDIILTPWQKEWLESAKKTEKEGKVHRRAVVTRNSWKWSSGVMPYVLDSSLSSAARLAISRAISEYSKATCITIRPRRFGDSSYIRFISGNGCYSYIGRIGGAQDISIGSGCERTGIVMHEIFHALGRWHEQSRPDRDQYVRINYGNIINGLESNFDKAPTTDATTNSIDYDIKSIMHYSAYAFSRNGAPTIVPLRASGFTRTQDVGQRDEFTQLDYEHVNKLYNCGGTTSAGTWGSWSSWGACSVSCNGGTQSRSRSCTSGSCTGSGTQRRSCNTEACSGTWGSWGSWSSCSCVTRTRRRTRRCLGGNCVGGSSQTRACTPSNCGSASSSTWGSWGAWKCLGSIRYRKRTCNGGSGACSGSAYKIDFCRSSCSCGTLFAPAAGSNNSPLSTTVTAGCKLLKLQEGQNLHTLGSDVVIGIFDKKDVWKNCISLAAEMGLDYVGVVGGHCISGSALLKLKDVKMEPSEDETQCENGIGRYNTDTSNEQYMDLYELDSYLREAVLAGGLKEEKSLELSGAKTTLGSFIITAILTSLTVSLV